MVGIRRAATCRCNRPSCRTRGRRNSGSAHRPASAPPGVVGTGQVRRAPEQFRQTGPQRVEAGLWKIAGWRAAAFPLGRRRPAAGWRPSSHPAGRPAIAPFELRGQAGIAPAISLERRPANRPGLGRSLGATQFQLFVDPSRNLKGRIPPSSSVRRAALTFVLAKRRAMHRRRALLVRARRSR